jgi:hypothetical protein
VNIIYVTPATKSTVREIVFPGIYQDGCGVGVFMKIGAVELGVVPLTQYSGSISAVDLF